MGSALIGHCAYQFPIIFIRLISMKVVSNLIPAWFCGSNGHDLSPRQYVSTVLLVPRLLVSESKEKVKRILEYPGLNMTFHDVPCMYTADELPCQMNFYNQIEEGCGYMFLHEHIFQLNNDFLGMDFVFFCLNLFLAKVSMLHVFFCVWQPESFPGRSVHAAPTPSGQKKSARQTGAQGMRVRFGKVYKEEGSSNYKSRPIKI